MAAGGGAGGPHGARERAPRGADVGARPQSDLDRALGECVPARARQSALDRVCSQDDELDRALRECYKRLGRREHTVAQLRRALGRAGIDEATAEQALGQVLEHGYLDDARFAELYAEDRRNLDAWGGERIRAQLEAAGVGRDVVEQTLATRTRADELEAAVAFLRERAGAPPRSDRERQRAWAMLARRGYEPELAYEAVREFERDATGPGTTAVRAHP
jgi:regulatory protein